MAYIKCPTCEQPNPSDAEICSNCGAALHEAIQPGDLPTKKVTSELEPILPQWLQEARQKSRQSTEDDIRDPSQDTKPRGAGPDDLLAGLEAQKGEDDEDEVPDWLAGITGTKGKKKAEPRFTGARRVELSGFPDFASEEKPAAEPQGEKQPQEKKDDLADWFKQATSIGSGQQARPPASEDRPPDIPFDQPTQEAPIPAPADDMSLDWMKSLQPEETGAPAQPAQPVEEELPSWLQPEQKESQAPAEDLGMPDWLKNLEGEPEAQEASAPGAPAAEEPVSLDWGTEFKPETPAAEPQAPASGAYEADLPDWLKGLTDQAPPFKQAENEEFSPEKSFSTDWLTRPVPEDSESSTPPSTAAEEALSLDWLKSLKAEPEQQEELTVPDWMAPSSAQASEKPVEAQEAPAAEEGTVPDWLKQPDNEEPATPAAQETEAPDWLNQEAASKPSESEALGASLLDVELPDWLQESGAESASLAKEEADLPDWLGSMPSTPAEQPPATPVAPATSAGEADLAQPAEEMPAWPPGSLPEAELPGSAESSLPPFSTPEPLTLGSLDSLFTDVPDWLSEAGTPAAHEPSELPPAAEEAETLTPGALPSWVQAMRPVETGSPGPGTVSGATLETKGALAGLQGVLPSTPYPGPSSKPKAQSLKLQASEEQQAHANLLEQILLAETRPEPMKVMPRISTQRSVRIAIGLILFIVLGLIVLVGSQSFPLPNAASAGTQGATDAIGKVPAGSAVLVVFDYEPSLAGEMEAATIPLLNKLITQSQPRMTILSATPTGSSLAERLLHGPLGSIQKDYLNIGYLPGGLGGVRSFVQDPVYTMPLALDRSLAWSAPQTQGVQRLSDYAAIILLVDSAEAGRIWIEQAEGMYGNSAFIVVASAQAGPMLQPYFDSGQISGLVTGLYDGAVLEQSGAGGPGLARRYWDAYNIGLILAIVLIGAGALWNLMAGMRERRSTEAG